MTYIVKCIASALLSLPICLLVITGCSSIGPRTVSKDSFDYTGVLAESWKQRMLINMVRIRYGDTPIFLDVVSVINQYSVETRGQVSMEWQQPLAGNANTFGLGGSATYTDRPTITYIPLSGAKFAQSLMKPLPPSAVMGMIVAGYPIDVVLRVCVESINSIRNSFEGTLREQKAHVEFYPLLERLRRIQDSGAINMRVKKTDGNEITIFNLMGKVDASVQEDSLLVRKSLGIDPTQEEFKVVYASQAKDDKEIALLTRSILQIINSLGAYIEVPEAHLAEKYVRPIRPEITPTGAPVSPLIKIYSSPSRPDNAFAAVPYQTYWFWIDNRDLKSKGIFTFLLFLFSLTETAGEGGAPVVTISAGG